VKNLSNPGRNGGRLKRLPKGVSGNPKGRPPQLYTKLIEELEKRSGERVSRTSLQSLIEVMLSMPRVELVAHSKDTQAPIVVQIIASALIKRNSLDALMSLLDRAHGRPKQAVDMSTNGNLGRVIDPEMPEEV
jgi:hypothetical protein